MRILFPAALVLAANLMMPSPADARGMDSPEPEASLSWRLGFGGGPIQPGYRLALGMRVAGLEDTVTPLVDLDVNDSQALARFAGLPLFGHRWQLNQADALPVEGAEPYRKPFLARQWVWWTAGGLALTAAALSGGGGGEDNACAGLCYDGGGDDQPQGEGINVVGGDINGPGDTHVCVLQTPETPDVCADAYVGRALGVLDGAHPPATRLDEGTGGMGDLRAR